MSHITIGSSASIEKPKSLVKKNIRFDEENIRENLLALRGDAETKSFISSLDRSQSFSGSSAQSHDEFSKKRKQFYQSEFIIAHQRPTSLDMPKPGPSIETETRFEDKPANPCKKVIPCALAKFIPTPSRQCSNANYDTLLEIAKQMSF